ncbi:MAG TPA: hypothetical protein VFJ43_10880, partial [Bacteroidia bacterium]|nr:hypothetical protein [Bacteroidia bacterium]
QPYSIREQLLEQLTSAEVPSSIKTIASLEIFTNLTSVFLEELAQNNSDLLTDQLEELLDVLVQQFNSKSISRETFVALQKNLVNKIQQNPKNALDALIAYPEKEMLRKVLPSILNEYTIQLLVRNSQNETRTVLSTLQHVLREVKRSNDFEELSDWMQEHLPEAGLETIIFHPGLNQMQTLEYILKEISERIPDKQLEQFVLFIDRMSRDSRFQSIAKSVEVIMKLKENFRFMEKQPVLKRVQFLMNISTKKQIEAGKLLTAHFSDREFTEIRKSKKQETKVLLNYLVRGGERLMETLVSEYSGLLSREMKHISRNEINSLLIDLFWKCILNYASHDGLSEKIRKSFHSAVLFHFALSEKSKILKKSAGKMIDVKEKKLSLRNGEMLLLDELFELIGECLSTGVQEIVNAEGKKFQLSELITAGLELKPAELRRIMAKIAVSEKGIHALKQAVSFRQFSLWILSDQRGELNSAMEAMRLLSDIITPVASGKMADSLIDDYWKLSWRLIRKNSWSAADLKKLIQESFVRLAKETNISADYILTEMKQKNVRLTPLLHKNLIECFPAFSSLSMHELANSTSEKMLEFERKGLLDNLAYHLIVQKQIPSWFGDSNEREIKDLLNEIVILHPEKFLTVMKREIISEPQMRWLSQTISFQKLIRAISYFNKNKQSHLGILDELYKT